MNIFLINPDPVKSAQLFAFRDPVRARKQLLECCQILASAEYFVAGQTTMRKANGDLYKRAHPHHPITKRCGAYNHQWLLCYDVAIALASYFPGHACSKTLCASTTLARPYDMDDPRLIVCRLGHEPLLVDNREQYSKILYAYIRTKWNKS